MSAIAIRRRFPSLRIPAVDLGTWPSPLRPLAPSLWVKDEGPCASYGGNKVRKLEWLLADAVRNGATDVITTGATGSNHVIAVAHHGRPLGLRTHALLVPQPDTAHVRENRARMDAVCASVRELAGPLAVPAALAWAWASLARAGRPYWIGPGGSSPLGTLGWVGGGLELADQLAAEGLVPDVVVVAAGSAGTAAGLAAGLALSGVGADVLAVRCVGAVGLSLSRVRRIAAHTLAMIGRCGGEVPAVELHVSLADDGFEGYGVPTARATAAAEVAASLGVYTEPTYTARSFAYALDAARAGRKVVWVDTVSRPAEVP